MRTRGEGGLERIGNIWYFTFYNLSGNQVRRSSKSRLKSVAVEMLKSAQGELRNGIEPVVVRRTKYEDIRAILIADYVASGKATRDGEDIRISGRRGLLAPLDEYFAGMPVSGITTNTIRRFIAKRLESGVKGPTVNRTLAYLRRMFRLAQREGKVINVPYFPMQQESKVRTGFLEPEQFRKLRRAMPNNLHPFLTFLYYTGCRFGAAKAIDWSWVNLKQGFVAIPEGFTKNREALTLPLPTELIAMLRRITPKQGPLFDTVNFRKEWNRACIHLGLGKKTGKHWYQYEGLIPHDFRRSAIRNMMQAGADQVEAMSISGHKTVYVFQRYNIVDERRRKTVMQKVERYTSMKRGTR